MYYFLRELFVKIKLKILSIGNVKRILFFVISKIVNVFDAGENFGKLIKSVRSLFRSNSKNKLAKTKDPLRLSSLSVASTSSTKSRILKEKHIADLSKKKEFPPLRNYDITYLKSQSSEKSRFPVLIENIQKSTSLVSKLSAKKISRYFKYMLFGVVVFMLLGMLIFIPFIGKLSKNFPQINGDDLRNLMIKQSEAFLQSSSATPTQFGNQNDQNNLWDKYSQTLISYKILKQSNSYNFNWVINFKYVFISSNPVSDALQSAYILNSTVNAKLVIIANNLAVKISLFKDWSTAFHYFFIPSFSLAKFIKASNYFRYRYIGTWNPILHKMIYAEVSFFWTNYEASYNIKAATFDLTTFAVSQKVVSFTIPKVSDSTSHSAGFDFKNYTVPYPEGTSPDLIIVSAFKGPQEIPITYKFEFDVHYVDFLLVKIPKPSYSNSSKNPQQNGNYRTSWNTKTTENYINIHNKPTLKYGDPNWIDNFPKDYDYIIPDVNVAFKSLLDPKIYTLIKTITFFSRLRMNNSTDDGKTDLDKIPRYNLFWPIYINKFELRFQDQDRKTTYLCLGQRWVNHNMPN